jgi:hypothetical protein
VVLVLPPIPTENLDASDVDQLTKYTRDLMLKALVKLTESPRGQQAFLANPGPLVAPTQDHDQQSSGSTNTVGTVEEEIQPDSLQTRKDEPDALRKRVVEKEMLQHGSAEEAVEGTATS